MGKNRTDFVKNAIPKVEVEVISAGALVLDNKKLKDKLYSHHSMQHIVDTKGAKEVLRRAVYGMLPKNKLRPKMMLNLKIKD